MSFRCVFSVVHDHGPGSGVERVLMPQPYCTLTTRGNEGVWAPCDGEEAQRARCPHWNGVLHEETLNAIDDFTTSVLPLFEKELKVSLNKTALGKVWMTLDKKGTSVDPQEARKQEVLKTLHPEVRAIVEASAETHDPSVSAEEFERIAKELEAEMMKNQEIKLVRAQVANDWAKAREEAAMEAEAKRKKEQERKKGGVAGGV